MKISGNYVSLNKKPAQYSKNTQNFIAGNNIANNKPSSVKGYPDNLVYFPNVSFGIGKYSKKNFDGDYVSYILNTYDFPSTVKSLLDEAMSSKEKADEFISAVTKNPKQSADISTALNKKLGGTENFLEWYYAKDGYVKRYEDYLKSKYISASTPADLLKIQPNWGYWAIERKIAQKQGYSQRQQDDLMSRGEINFEFGKLPEAFVDKLTFSQLISEIKALPFNPQNVIISCYYGKKYNVTQLPGGDLSAKNIYKITDSKSGKSFILKIDRFYPEDIVKENSENPYDSRIIKEGKHTRGDSVYLNACIDYYLQLNGCHKTADLLYYNFSQNAAIYEYIEDNANSQNKSSLSPQIKTNKEFSELNDFGIFLNDVGQTTNYKKDKDGKLRIIDIGHAEYIDLLKPGARLLTIELNNLCGFSIKNALAALNTGAIKKMRK
ncbi:hypothetical protein II906_07045 [bacterium]|nr:hypothetical protein [bacterium]